MSERVIVCVRVSECVPGGGPCGTVRGGVNIGVRVRCRETAHAPKETWHSAKGLTHSHASTDRFEEHAWESVWGAASSAQITQAASRRFHTTSQTWRAHACAGGIGTRATRTASGTMLRGRAPAGRVRMEARRPPIPWHELARKSARVFMFQCFQVKSHESAKASACLARSRRHGERRTMAGQARPRPQVCWRCCCRSRRRCVRGKAGPSRRVLAGLRGCYVGAGTRAAAWRAGRAGAGEGRAGRARSCALENGAARR